MPDSLLQILKICLLAVVMLFFLRVLRAVWASLAPPTVAPAPAGVGKPGGAASGARAGSGTAGAGAGAPAQALRLRIVEPPEAKDRVFDLGDEVTVGRAPGCGVALEDTTVSHLHARAFRRDGKLWVEDLGSTNGTWVNRRKVAAPVQLRRGDRLQVGSTVMEVIK